MSARANARASGLPVGHVCMLAYGARGACQHLQCCSCSPGQACWVDMLVQLSMAIMRNCRKLGPALCQAFVDLCASDSQPCRDMFVSDTHGAVSTPVGTRKLQDGGLTGLAPHLPGK